MIRAKRSSFMMTRLHGPGKHQLSRAIPHRVDVRSLKRKPQAGRRLRLLSCCLNLGLWIGRPGTGMGCSSTPDDEATALSYIYYISASVGELPELWRTN
jgi:hypothetical protein